jgi:hypothetical protein
MSTSLIDILKSGTPAPKVVLLPDSCFFVRSVSLDAQNADIAGQVELALEGLSPFPVPQLLHGHHTSEPATRALVFAAYRRRFTVDEVDAWVQADWVAPLFAPFLHHRAEPGTTIMYPSSGYLTAVHWDAEAFPSLVSALPVPEDADEAARAALRSQLLAGIGGTLKLVELDSAPEVLPPSSEGSYSFKAGSLLLQVPVSGALALDVRPKEDLQGLMKARRRSVLLWRCLAGLAACVALLVVGELSIIGTRFFHKANQQKAETQRPVVSKIMTSQALAFRIDELSTRRLLPFEMLTALSEKKPRSIQFVRVSTNGLLGMKVEASTANSADIATYQAALQANAAIATVDVGDLSSRDRTTRFTLQVNFKPGALVAASE